MKDLNIKTLSREELVEALAVFTRDAASYYMLDPMDLAKEIRPCLLYTGGLKDKLGKYSSKVLTEDEILEHWCNIGFSLQDCSIYQVAIRIRFELIKIQMEHVIGHFQEWVDWQAYEGNPGLKPLIEYYGDFIKV